MSDRNDPTPLPPGLLRDLTDTFHRHGHHVDPTDVLPALITLLHGGERRTSTQLIYEKLAHTYQRPEDDFTRGERHGRADDLHLITGHAHAGILQRAATIGNTRPW